MKKNKRGILLLFIMLGMLFANTKTVDAGSVNTSLDAKSIVNVGDNVTVNIALDNINDATDGIGSMDSILEYDTNYFELVKITSKCSMYIGFNEVTPGKIKQSGFATAEGLEGNSVDIWQVVLKTKQPGKASIKLNGLVIGDGSAQLLTNDKNTITKEITINNNEEKNVANQPVTVEAPRTNNNEIAVHNMVVEDKEENTTLTEENFTEETQTMENTPVEENNDNAKEGNFFTNLAKNIAKGFESFFKQLKKLSFSNNAIILLKK